MNISNCCYCAQNHLCRDIDFFFWHQHRTTGVLILGTLQDSAETPFFSWGGDCLTAYFCYNSTPKARSSHPAGTRETERFTIFNPYPYFFCLFFYFRRLLLSITLQRQCAHRVGGTYNGDVNKSGKITLE